MAYVSFEAPQTYLDFNAEALGDDWNDTWFDSHEEYPDSIHAGARAIPAGNTEVVLKETTNQNGATGETAAKEQPVKKKNIVTSWGNDVPKKSKADGAKEKRPAMKVQPEEVAVAQPGAPAQAKRSKAARAEARHDASKKDRLGKGLKVAKIVVKKAKSAAPCTSVAAAAAAASGAAAKAKAAKLAKAVPPALASLKVMPMRSGKLTVIDDFELATSKRAEAHTQRAGREATKHQVVTGRHGAGRRAGDDDDDDDGSGSEGDTADGSPYKPLVLRVKEFDKTPGRFKREPEPPKPAKPLVLTDAREPRLITSARVRPSEFKPREVLEEEEMASMPHFKASTLNPLILMSTSGQLGVHKVEKREITAPRPFNFVTDDRAEARAERARRQQEQEEAAAREARRREKKQRREGGGERQTVSDTEGSDGGDRGDRALPAKTRKSVAAWPHLSATLLAKSPMLHTKFRARKVTTEEERFEFHARPVPKYLSMPSLELPRGHNFAEGAPAPTEPRPFRLATEARGSRHRSQLESKLAEAEREAARARIPRAHGLPQSTDVPLVPPKPEPRGCTVPEPFSLASEARHAQYEEQKRRELEEEEEARRAEAAFKARPMWQGIPFRPLEIEMPVTIPEPVSFHTSARAEKRGEFDRFNEERLRQMEQRAEEERQRTEEEERRRLRKAAKFVARPMPDLSVPVPVGPAPPPKPVTVPMSPALGRRKRRKHARRAMEQVEEEEAGGKENQQLSFHRE